jgi:predicted HAD superfamily Cof-like phosphohydrolase
MTREQQMVLDFHKAVGHCWQSCPHADLPYEEVMLRVRVIEEEFDELVEAMNAKNLISIADGLADLLYVVYGCGLAYGLDLEPIFAEVHRSNMTKTGAPKDAQGKVMKGAQYEPPRLAEVLQVLSEHTIG